MPPRRPSSYKGLAQFVQILLVPKLMLGVYWLFRRRDCLAFGTSLINEYHRSLSNNHEGLMHYAKHTYLCLHPKSTKKEIWKFYWSWFQPKTSFEVEISTSLKWVETLGHGCNLWVSEADRSPAVCSDETVFYVQFKTGLMGPTTKGT